MPQAKPTPELSTEQLVNSVLSCIDREREREIVSRRFGLFERRETLEQIGEMLGITRERVRQLEKSVVTRLKTMAEQGSIPNLAGFEAKIIELLNESGEVARVSQLSAALSSDPNREEQSRVAFLSQLCPKLTIIQEDDNYYYSVGVKSVFDEKTLKSRVENLINVIKKIGEPKKIDAIAKSAGIDNPKEAEALASTSKQLATLNGRWGLIKWPMVNPKNIRDKIYVILKENGKHMHFNEISASIKESDFKRKDVDYSQLFTTNLLKTSDS